MTQSSAQMTPTSPSARIVGGSASALLLFGCGAGVLETIRELIPTLQQASGVFSCWKVWLPIVLSIVLPAGVLVFLWSWGRQRWGRDSAAPAPMTWLAIASAAWGAAISGVAGWSNHHVDIALARLAGTWHSVGLCSFITAPFVEEGLKATGVLLLMCILATRRRHIVGASLGLVMGFSAGLAFQTVENIEYAATFAINDPLADAAGASSTAWSRFCYCLISHDLYTAVTGMGIGLLLAQPGAQEGPPWFARMRRHRRRSAVLCYGSALLVHGLWDGTDPATTITLGLLIVLGVAFARRLRSRRQPSLASGGE